ncbi:hypothetical protein GCM10010965_30850 [Caldalkalibacillus thermarum]|uniref:hypothetical protein n=1 Tax=Caldalkalibacillus thermarum TaxID=296745 RepID=UPI00166649BE|nr:hypothetical protein [Caldalkalibacillus thermarum]GGK35705.1 hypothetical protein GCM10010965_30850 [Caldalkalibacillus thermarum]
MKQVYVRGSTLVILSYIWFIVFIWTVIVEWMKGNDFDSFYLIAVYMGVVLWFNRKVENKTEQNKDKSIFEIKYVLTSLPEY